MVLTDGNQKDGSVDIHARQSSDDSTATEQELAANKDIRDKGKDHEY